MKRIFYISLMSILGLMLTTSFYFVVIYGLVMNRIVPLRSIIVFTDMTLSSQALITMGIVGLLIGYRAGKKWWQIIYVDGVYYFNKTLKPISSGKTKTPRGRRIIKKTQE